MFIQYWVMYMTILVLWSTTQSRSNVTFSHGNLIFWYIYVQEISSALECNNISQQQLIIEISHDNTKNTLETKYTSSAFDTLHSWTENQTITTQDYGKQNTTDQWFRENFLTFYSETRCFCLVDCLLSGVVCVILKVVLIWWHQTMNNIRYIVCIYIMCIKVIIWFIHKAI